ncbi:MAG: hypothetical protein PHV97_04115, partial [Candidatus Omnitrophica bacterium]|nr:hypothetical protein [Candidatus Omnitrophota bacterium]
RDELFPGRIAFAELIGQFYVKAENANEVRLAQAMRKETASPELFRALLNAYQAPVEVKPSAIEAVKDLAERETAVAEKALEVSKVQQPIVKVPVRSELRDGEIAKAIAAAQSVETMRNEVRLQEVANPVAVRAESRMTAKIVAMMKDLGLQSYGDQTRLVVSYERLGLAGMMELRHQNPKATIVVMASAENTANAEADIMGYQGFELAPNDLALVAREQLKAFDLKLQPGEVSKSVVQILKKSEEARATKDEIRAYALVGQMGGVLAFLGFDQKVGFATERSIADILNSEIRAAESIAQSA